MTDKNINSFLNKLNRIKEQHLKLLNDLGDYESFDTAIRHFGIEKDNNVKMLEILASMKEDGEL